MTRKMRAMGEERAEHAHGPDDPATLPDLRALAPKRSGTELTRVAGQVLAGRYRIDRLLAQGAMGRVYVATQLRLDRPVAVKIMHPTGDPRFAKRFCREASIASQLTHPNIVSVYDYGETTTGDLFMVMEHCEGRPLSVVLHEEAPFTAERTVDVAIQIARALKKAHDEGVVHRDLKPANIILSADVDGTDHVKVLDFGLVKLFAPEESELQHPDEDNLTRPGNMVGTPEYVSPEQALGDEVDGRADVYSLGVLMFQMVSGKLPYQGKSMLETITQHFQAPIPRVHEVAPGIECPMELEAIIRRALAKARHDRYPSMSELLLDLKSAWRNLTDESFGSETSFPAIDGARLPPIGLRDLGFEAPEPETCEVGSRGHVAHDPRCLDAADIALSLGHTPLPHRIVASDHAVAPDPSELEPSAFDLAPGDVTRVPNLQRAPRRLGPAIAAVLFMCVALGAGAYWIAAVRPESPALARAPSEAPARTDSKSAAPVDHVVEPARDEASNVVEPAKPADGVDHAKPADVVEGVKPAEVTEPAKPAEVAEPAEPELVVPIERPKAAPTRARAAEVAPAKKSAKPAKARSYKDNPY